MVEAMRFDQGIKNKQFKELWDQYCGFLDIDINEMMAIQERLLIEQIELMKNSELGKKVFRHGTPTNIEEFRSMVELTSYDFYADTLLTHRENALPLDVVTWIETTWEGGRHPIKTAPYTKPMLDSFRNNTIACLMLAPS